MRVISSVCSCAEHSRCHCCKSAAKTASSGRPALHTPTSLRLHSAVGARNGCFNQALLFLMLDSENQSCDRHTQRKPCGCGCSRPSVVHKVVAFITGLLFDILLYDTCEVQSSTICPPMLLIALRGWSIHSSRSRVHSTQAHTLAAASPSCHVSLWMCVDPLAAT